jgi:hypothetical protein
MTKRNLLLLPLLSLLAVAATTLWPSAPSVALDDPRYSVEVLVDGVPLPEYSARGTTYVEALRGRSTRSG